MVGLDTTNCFTADSSYPLSRALIEAFDSTSLTRATSSAIEIACVHEVRSSIYQPFIPLLDKWLKAAHICSSMYPKGQQRIAFTRNTVVVSSRRRSSSNQTCFFTNSLAVSASDSAVWHLLR